MGATNFSTEVIGRSAEVAFKLIVEHARHEYGHGGYSGTIAEKDDFVMIRDTPEDVLKRDVNNEISPWNLQDLRSADPKRQRIGVAGALMDLDDDRISDKWGPAGCIELEPGRYLFFGYAPE
jgi:hypothetical protein